MLRMDPDQDNATKCLGPRQAMRSSGPCCFVAPHGPRAARHGSTERPPALEQWAHPTTPCGPAPQLLWPFYSQHHFDTKLTPHYRSVAGPGAPNLVPLLPRRMDLVAVVATLLYLLPLTIMHWTRWCICMSKTCVAHALNIAMVKFTCITRTHAELYADPTHGQVFCAPAGICIAPSAGCIPSGVHLVTLSGWQRTLSPTAPL